jgi:hypothetical protein
LLESAPLSADKEEFMRKTLFAVVAAVVLGMATMTTGAMARPMGGHPSFGHSFGRGFAYRGYGGRFYGPGVGLYAYTGCWIHRRVWTPFGWRWRLVEVC